MKRKTLIIFLLFTLLTACNSNRVSESDGLILNYDWTEEDYVVFDVLKSLIENEKYTIQVKLFAIENSKIVAAERYRFVIKKESK